MSLEKALRQKFKKAQAELAKEKELKIEEMKEDSSDSESEDKFSIIKKKRMSVVEANKLLNTRKQLQNMLKQSRLDSINEREVQEKTFEPITHRLDKVERAVKETDKDLSKKLKLIPYKASDHFHPLSASSPKKDVALKKKIILPIE